MTARILAVAKPTIWYILKKKRKKGCTWTATPNTEAERPTSKQWLKVAAERACRAPQGMKQSTWWCAWVLNFREPLTANIFCKF